MVATTQLSAIRASKTAAMNLQLVLQGYIQSESQCTAPECNLISQATSRQRQQTCHEKGGPAFNSSMQALLASLTPVLMQSTSLLQLLLHFRLDGHVLLQLQRLSLCVTCMCNQHKGLQASCDF